MPYEVKGKTLILELLRESLLMSENIITVKNFLYPQPSEISDIFDLCKNEIILLNNRHDMQFYRKIYFDCLMSQRKLTLGNVDIIGDVRKFLSPSIDENEARKQYKNITSPNSTINADLLKMLNDYKPLKFIDEKFKDWEVINTLLSQIETQFTGEISISNNFTKQILKAKIKIN